MLSLSNFLVIRFNKSKLLPCPIRQITVQLQQKFVLFTPLAFTNKMTVNSLNRKTDIVNIGRMSFDFSNGYTPCCVFKEYCL